MKSAEERDVFFFQAEDGIRDIGVTGVQTCALPIYDARFPDAVKQEMAATGDRAGIAVPVVVDGSLCGVLSTSGRAPRRWTSEEVRDRKSGVEGKSVDLGGRRIINKKRSTHPRLSPT